MKNAIIVVLILCLAVVFSISLGISKRADLSAAQLKNFTVALHSSEMENNRLSIELDAAERKYKVDVKELKYALDDFRKYQKPGSYRARLLEDYLSGGPLERPDGTYDPEPTQKESTSASFSTSKSYWVTDATGSRLVDESSLQSEVESAQLRNAIMASDLRQKTADEAQHNRQLEQDIRAERLVRAVERESRRPVYPSTVIQQNNQQNNFINP